MRYIIILFAFLLINFNAVGSNKFSPVEMPIDTSAYPKLKGNSNFSGHARTFFMNTINEAALLDYYALGVGAGLSFRRELFKNLEFGTSGFFVFNLLSNDLSKKDSLAKQSSRYEVGLFDIEDPKNKENMDRLEELFLKWKNKQFSITIGRQFIETPFINKQDGRMRPTLSEGLYINFKPTQDFIVDAAWINRISPRSTVRWFSIEESIGIYPSGFNINGSPNLFKNNLTSKGVMLLGINFKKKHYELKFNNTFIENISNTTFLQQELGLPITYRNAKLILGFQAIRQDAVNAGGNTDQNITYFKKGDHSWVFSSRIGIENSSFSAKLNYTRITNDHQFLFPREWGREPFYTFMQRERNEGLSDAHAFTLNTAYQFNKQIKVSIGYGRYYLKDVSDFEHNRYGLPAYSQVNILLDGALDKIIKGLNWNVLMVYKAPIKNKEYLSKFVMNRINMFHSEVVLNYHF